MLRLNYPWMIVWGIGLHLLYAGGLVIEGKMVGNLLLLVGLSEFLEYLSPGEFGIILGFAALLGLLGLIGESTGSSRRTAFMMLMPQFFFMLAAFIADAWIMLNGYKSPTTGLPVAFIVLLVALGPIMLAALLHTLSILQYYVFVPGAKTEVEEGPEWK